MVRLQINRSVIFAAIIGLILPLLFRANAAGFIHPLASPQVFFDHISTAILGAPTYKVAHDFLFRFLYSAHRALAAAVACSLVLALLGPFVLPPSRPRATAAGFFRVVMLLSRATGPEAISQLAGIGAAVHVANDSANVVGEVESRGSKQLLKVKLWH